MTTQEDHAIELRIEDLVAGSPDVDLFAVGVAVPTDAVEVDVDHHVVTLRGQLSSRIERAEVRHVVEAVHGVDFVHNRITL